MRKYIRTVGRVKDGGNVAGLASGLIWSVQGMNVGRSRARFVPMTE